MSIERRVNTLEEHSPEEGAGVLVVYEGDGPSEEEQAALDAAEAAGTRVFVIPANGREMRTGIMRAGTVRPG